MGFDQVFAISGAGMAVERMRVNVAALNMANANTIWPLDGVGFQPMRVIAHGSPGSRSSFANMVSAAARGDLGSLLPDASVMVNETSPRRVHDATHPLADAQGFVSYPGVDMATEMMSLMTATRAYEANIAAFNAAKTLALKTLDIGGRGS